MFLAADGSAQIRSIHDAYAIRFHLHPSVKATKVNDGHGVMLVTPSKEVWIFTAHQDHAELEDSVYLAGTDGPRRTTQLVVYGNARNVPRVLWTFQQANSAAAPSVSAGRRVREEEPKLPP